MKTHQFRELFNMQMKLDQRILEKHHLHDADLIPKKMLAFLVELGELANETRAFKFWSIKPPSEKSVILEEYVDGVHFILSLGLDIGYSELELNVANKQENIVDQLQKVFDTAIAFRYHQTPEYYEQLFKEYIILGHSLDFTMDNIFEAYYAKNKVNHDRQQNNY